MPPAKWRKEKGVYVKQEIRTWVLFVIVVSVLVVIGTILVRRPCMMLCGQTHHKLLVTSSYSNLNAFDCIGSLQSAPVVAHKVEGTPYPFFISLADLGTPEKPNRNFQRLLKGKLFRKPDISETIQLVLEGLEKHPQSEEKPLVIDVGANIGMATFAAAAMGYRVLAFEAVLENVQKLCDGVYLNRVPSAVKLYHAAVSDQPGNITLHKVTGRLDNSAVSATGAMLAFKSNKLVPITVKTVTLDSVISSSDPVLLLKIDVQGWEYHVLQGATRLLSRPSSQAPYLIYEDDDKLLQESNSTSQEILQFLAKYGYTSCSRKAGDQHCTKKASS